MKVERENKKKTVFSFPLYVCRAPVLLTQSHTHTHTPFHWTFSGDSRAQVLSFYLVCIALLVRVQGGTQEPRKAIQVERGFRARYSVYKLFARQQFGSLKNKRTKRAISLWPGNYTLGLNENYGRTKTCT